MSVNAITPSLLPADILRLACLNTLRKLAPKQQIRNPILFTVYMSAIVTSCICALSLYVIDDAHSSFIFSVSICLWLTIIFANFAEALAEGRGKVQAESLRKAKKDIIAKKLAKPDRTAKYTLTPTSDLRINDIVLVEAMDFVPSDGIVIEGIATVNESAVTGESAPVIRESGGDRNMVTGGTQVISDWLLVKIVSNPGETFLDQMIYLVEGTRRKKTPSELSLNVFLTSLTIVFLIICVTLLPFSIYSVNATHNGSVISITVVIALFVCLAPTTIGSLLSAISIAGMDRMIQANILVLSPKVVESAGDIDTLIMDKTGTITLGNRHATEFIPAQGTSIDELVNAAQLSSLADETPEGRSIVVLAKIKYNLRGRRIKELQATFIPFTAQTRMSGANMPGRQIRKGAASAIEAYVRQQGGELPQDVRSRVDAISRKGGTALVVAEQERVLGVIHLKDIVKGGIRERFAQLRKMGIKTIMVTGDNQLTAAAIAAEAGVDDFLADALPADKLELIRRLQAEGHLVAMAGDGTNDAPALAQADIAMAMNSGTQAAKEAGNLVDLDSNPTKLIEVVEIGKQLLMTRGALTTFSLASDIAKNVAILPAAFISTYPALESLDIMHLASRESAILSAVIFNALIILILIPLALFGVKYRKVAASTLLLDNLIIYGLGGLIAPFLGIKMIDEVLKILGLV